jgi:hypothetical protein
MKNLKSQGIVHALVVVPMIPHTHTHADLVMTSVVRIKGLNSLFFHVIFLV